jgi:hypothetical protein
MIFANTLFPNSFKEPTLVNPKKYAELYCPYCGMRDSLKIEEASTITEKRPLKSRPRAIIYQTAGVCQACDMRVEMTLEQWSKPLLARKRKERKNV